MFGRTVKACPACSGVMLAASCATPSLCGSRMLFTDNTSACRDRSDDRNVDREHQVWFETRWGIAAFVVAVCLAGSGSLYYVFNYLAVQ